MQFLTLSNHPVSKLVSNLIDEFERRISEINSFLPRTKILETPTAIDATTTPNSFQLELLNLQEDVEVKGIFQSEGLLYFWSRVSEGKYPNLITH